MKTPSLLSRLSMGPLAVCAAARALWIMARPRSRAWPLANGWRGRTDLASRILAAGLLAILHGGLGAQEPPIMCYEMQPPVHPEPLRSPSLPKLLKITWRALDPEQGEAFRKQIVAAERRNLVSPDARRLLILAYGELAQHKRKTRDERITCYKMSAEGAARQASRERLLQQVELLAKARSTGLISQTTLDRAAGVLAQELAVLDPKSSAAVAREAADHIVDMERDEN